MMPDTTPHPVMTTGALELIRTLAELGANINRMRATLRAQEGVWFKDIDIIEAGRSLGFEIVPTAHGPTIIEPIVQLVPRQTGGRAPDRVRLVTPGTWAVPVGGYRMGGSRGRS